jgi:peptidoglycan/xylan/chitin deacetylase (PgdA/CDA1 family)
MGRFGEHDAQSPILLQFHSGGPIVTARLLVLGWHNVEPTWCFPAAPGKGAAGLAEQLAFLRRTCNVVPLGDALRALAEGRPLPPRAVALTFDDGYRDSLELAVPLLERLQLPATFFLVPELLSGIARPWWETIAWALSRSRNQEITWEGRTISLRGAAQRRAANLEISTQLKRRDQAARDAAIEELTGRCQPAPAPGAGDPRSLFMDWGGAGELIRRGFEVASHSHHHAILAMESREEQARDLSESRLWLQRELDAPIGLLAYPNGLEGDYDAATIEAARAAGYSHAVTTIGGWNRPGTPAYEVHRFVQQPERGAKGLAIVPLHPVWKHTRSWRDRLRKRLRGRPGPGAGTGVAVEPQR